MLVQQPGLGHICALCCAEGSRGTQLRAPVPPTRGTVQFHPRGLGMIHPLGHTSPIPATTKMGQKWVKKKAFLAQNDPRPLGMLKQVK